MHETGPTRLAAFNPNDPSLRGKVVYPSAFDDLEKLAIAKWRVAVVSRTSAAGT